MEENILQAIYNYRRVSDLIGTSGMPTEAQLPDIARAGFQVVINLDQLTSRHALPNERETVEILGMTYVQIPVLWDEPTHADFVAFCAVLEQFVDRRVFIHCVANARVSTFVALYRILRLGWPREVALQSVQAIYQPNATWQHFIESELTQ